MQKQRRDFVKITTAGAAGLVLTKADRLLAAWPATGTMEINPDISNMRVVGCKDTSMVKSTPSQMTFTAQNSAVDTARVHANMDDMAKQLAETDTAEAAWKAIFRSSKPWESTVVAIKVNTIEARNMPRIAIIQKLSAVLVGFGVSPSNITIYDAGGSMASVATSEYSTYCSTTDKTKTQAVVGSMGNKVSTPIGGGSSAPCVANLSSGKVDILINVAVNKGHSVTSAGTLCMKNHFGTFDPNHTNVMDYIVNINKSDAIVGGTPPRQQLCIIDSLFAMKNGPGGSPDVMPCYLTMGVFAPAVDYLTIKKVREAVMSCSHTAANVNTLVTSFGYTTNDPEWVEVPPASTTTPTNPDAGAGGKGGAGGNDSTGAGGRTNGGSGGSGRTGTGGASSEPQGSGGQRTAGGSGAGGNRRRGAGGAGAGGQADTTGSGVGGEGGEVGGTDDVGPGAAGSSALGKGGSDATSTTPQNGGKGGGTGKTTGANTGLAGAGEDPGAGSGSDAPEAESCGCHVPKTSFAPSQLGAAALIGAAMAGQLRRLFVRRDALAGATHQEEQPGPSERKESDERATSDVADAGDGRKDGSRP